MFTRRTDLQLERDSLGRFLPWLIAFMVYLSVLAFAGMLALDDIAGRWDRGMSGSLTVQMASSANTDPNNDKQMQAVLAVLKSTPGIATAEALSEQKLMALLEPWLGQGAFGAELPLPRLIDVTLKNDADINVAALEQRLKAVAPGASVDDHGVWLEHLINLIQTVKALALAVLVFIALATTATVIFATRTGLAIHHEAIEVLHLIGAQDSYIARQFASRALMLGLRGGIFGLLLALPTIWGIGSLARSLQSGLLPEFSLGLAHWAMLGGLPVVVALIAMISARLTVMKTLAKML
ncbi:MAG: cell division protein [Rhodospirillales bacterium]|nr:cell division protein [Rhodospirillales bacterium]